MPRWRSPCHAGPSLSSRHRRRAGYGGGARAGRWRSSRLRTRTPPPCAAAELAADAASMRRNRARRFTAAATARGVSVGQRLLSLNCSKGMCVAEGRSQNVARKRKGVSREGAAIRELGHGNNGGRARSQRSSAAFVAEQRRGEAGASWDWRVGHDEDVHLRVQRAVAARPVKSPC